MRRPTAGRARALAVAALGLTVLGCASAPPPHPAQAPGPSPGEVPAIVARWADEWRSFVGLGAAVDLTVKARGRADRAAGVLLLAPDALRLEIAAPFGLPAVVVVARPDQVTIFRVLERRASVGRPTPESVARWLGVPVAPETLIPLLVGQVPLPLSPAAVRLETASPPYLAYEREGVAYRAWVGDDGRPVRFAVLDGNRERLVARFERGPTGALERLTLEAPGQGAEVALRYISAAYAEAPVEAFTLTLPSDVRIERFD